MKSLRSNYLCCTFKLYKLGLIIGFSYIISSIIIISIPLDDANGVFTLLYTCAITLLTTVVMIRGLIKEIPEFLLPWLINTALLIIYNIVLTILHYIKLYTEEAEVCRNKSLGLLIALMSQLESWNIIYTLRKRGCVKHQQLVAKAKTSFEILNKVIGLFAKKKAIQEENSEKVDLMDNEKLEVICN